MAEASTTSSCVNGWGQCMRDERCHDTLCPGHPVLTCSSCIGERCPTHLACHVPEPTPASAPRPRTFLPTFDITGPHLPQTRHGWGRVLQAAIGIAGCFLIAGALGRFLGVL